MPLTFNTVFLWGFLPYSLTFKRILVVNCLLLLIFNWVFTSSYQRPSLQLSLTTKGPVDSFLVILLHTDVPRSSSPIQPQQNFQDI